MGQEHSLLLVIIRPDSLTVMGAVERLMAPYEGEDEYEERDVECECVENLLRERARAEVAEKQLYTLYEAVILAFVPGGFKLKETHWLRRFVGRMADPKRPKPEPSRRDIEEQMSYLRWGLKAAKPDPQCALCHGRGLVKGMVKVDQSTIEWSIGDGYTQYWAKYLDGDPNAIEGFPVAESDPDLVKYTGDVIPVHLLLKAGPDGKCPLPDYLVTPDGEWHEADESFLYSEEKRERKRRQWLEFCRSIYVRHSNCLAVVCHYRD